jgi:hypothetical protein
MSVDFIKAGRETPFLFYHLFRKRPQDYPARFVVDIVGQLNPSSLQATYSGQGAKPYDSPMWLWLIFMVMRPVCFRVESWNRPPMILSPSARLPLISIRTMIPWQRSVNVFLRRFRDYLFHGSALPVKWEC